MFGCAWREGAMTEADWLTSSDAAELFAYARYHLGRATVRKLRLVAVARARRVLHLMSDERSRTALAVAEHLADEPGLPVRLPAEAAREAARGASAPAHQHAALRQAGHSAARAAESVLWPAEGLATATHLAATGLAFEAA